MLESGAEGHVLPGPTVTGLPTGRPGVTASREKRSIQLFGQTSPDALLERGQLSVDGGVSKNPFCKHEFAVIYKGR